MRIRFFNRIRGKKRLLEIKALLVKCDKEFVPPLSKRGSTQQKIFDVESGKGTIDKYFEDICRQSAFVAEDHGHVVGFMSFLRDVAFEEISPDYPKNIYITTVIVDPDFRHRGITIKFYKRMFARFGNLDVFTRTWSKNQSHINILSYFKFFEHCRKEDDRGPGIDTVYYRHAPTRMKWRQTISQYRLGGNLVFLLFLTVLSVAFVLTWIFTDGEEVMHELSIAFATSLIASALCLLSDSMLKYRDSKNDDYINNLKSFGIENLQFHKDELLESIMPRCRHEIWITGYRLIMTGKLKFREALRKACRRTRGLRVRVLAVPPWIETYRLVYGDEDVTLNYVNIISDLCECAELYGTDLEIRFTDKPIFNDTYKVDDRFITSPYMHCVDEENNRITAKDFFSLDINDPRKELYTLIERDYIAVWDESAFRLDLDRFRREFPKDEARSKKDKEQRRERLKRCCVPIKKVSGDT